MKTLYFYFILFLLVSCGKSNNEWTLVWEEDFNKDGVIDEKFWSKIPRGKPDWSNYMSSYDSLYNVKDGNLILKGIVNPGIEGDTAKYITGGIYTKNKKGFGNGKIEIRAKFENAQGAWPAFWLLPFDNSQWPYGGEIDIMERLNSDDFVYQTVHSNYTYNLDIKTPKSSSIGKINMNEYNNYSVELYKDSVVFRTNGVHTLTYPRIETDKEGQFPFDRDFYLLLDMQLEGNWVGKANPEDLPVSMYIDWVRFYQKED